MSEKVLKVGVVGLGQIAQIMHLHYLKELPSFEIACRLRHLEVSG